MPSVKDDLVSAKLIPLPETANLIKRVDAIMHNSDESITTKQVNLKQRRPDGTIGYKVTRVILEPITEYVVIRGNLDKDGMLQIGEHESIRPHYITT